MFGRRPRIAAAICAHNEEQYIEYCLRSIYDFADVVIVSVNTGTPWGGTPEPLDGTLDLVRSFPDPDGKLRIRTGEWSDEVEERVGNLELAKKQADYYMTVDADEMYLRQDLVRLRRYISLRPYAGQFRLRLNTYWKTNPFYVIDPPEPLRAHVLTRLRLGTGLVGIRRSTERWRITVPRHVAVLHHFSYARSSDRVHQKLLNTLHRDELVPDWYENVWLRWDQDHGMENLHPTHPAEYKRAIAVELNSLPEVMRDHPFAQKR
jgi:hypothetical protein